MILFPLVVFDPLSATYRSPSKPLDDQLDIIDLTLAPQGPQMLAERRDAAMEELRSLRHDTILGPGLPGLLLSDREEVLLLHHWDRASLLVGQAISHLPAVLRKEVSQPVGSLCVPHQ